MEKTWKEYRKTVCSLSPDLGTRLILFFFLHKSPDWKEFFDQKGFVRLRSKRTSSSADSTARLLLFRHKYLASKDWMCLTYQPVISQCTGGTGSFPMNQEDWWCSVPSMCYSIHLMAHNSHGSIHHCASRSLVSLRGGLHYTDTASVTHYTASLIYNNIL